MSIKIISGTRERRSLLIAMMLTAAAQLSAIDTATAAVGSPVVTEAIGGNGIPVTVGNFDNVDAIGYEVREFFLTGEADSYASREKLTKDGKWSAVHAVNKPAAYKTRVVVYTPKDATRFNGTVYVEWQNNTGFADAAPDWVHGHIEVARQGAAYVLASVQPIGIATLQAEKAWWVPVQDVSFPISDAVRYESLKHPGGKYAYDIYSQIGQAVRDGGLLHELVPQRVIGVGESQSAFWLTTYVNGIQPLAAVYDGFVLHSSFGAGMPLGNPPFGSVGVTSIRDDLVPVILFQSETDVQLGAGNTRQPESQSGKFRLWEVAGTAHFDSYGLDVGVHDTGAGEGEAISLDYLKNPLTSPSMGLMQCADGINSGPMHWVFNAALSWINRWVIDGTAPPIAPRLETMEPHILLARFITDEHGNTRGGIRTPFVDVPLAKLGGFGNSAAPGASFISNFCGLFGHTIPLSEQTLKTLYTTDEDFAAQFRAAALRAVESGFLLSEDASMLMDAAENHVVVDD